MSGRGWTTYRISGSVLARRNRACGSNCLRLKNGSTSEKRREEVPVYPRKCLLFIYTVSILFLMTDRVRVYVKGNPERLRLIRIELRWTQARFAEVLGVRLNTLARWERGDLVPPRVAELAAEYIRLSNSGRKRRSR